MPTDHIISVWKRLFVGFMILTVAGGCSLAAINQPTAPPTMPPGTVSIPPSLTPFPPTIVGTSPAATLTLTSSPTNTALPTLSSFNSALTFGGAGGGGRGMGCGPPIYPPPVVYAIQPGESLHLITFCAYEYPVPIGALIHLSISSADGRYTLQDDFQMEPVQAMCTETYCPDWGIDYWWPLGLPVGTWQWTISWDGGGASGTLLTSTTSPELSILDNLAYLDLRETNSGWQCHLSTGSTGLVATGRGFPPGSTIYLPVYEGYIGGMEYQPYYVQTALSDNSGSFATELSGPFESGRSYVVLGLLNPDESYIIQGQDPYINPDLENRMDCFITP